MCPIGVNDLWNACLDHFHLPPSLNPKIVIPKPIYLGAQHIKSLLQQNQTTENDPCRQSLDYLTLMAWRIFCARLVILFSSMFWLPRAECWNKKWNIWLLKYKHSVSKNNVNVCERKEMKRTRQYSFLDTVNELECRFMVASKNWCLWVYEGMFCTTCICVCIRGVSLSTPDRWTSIDSSDSGSGSDTSSLLSCIRGRRMRKRRNNVSIKQQNNKSLF